MGHKTLSDKLDQIHKEELGIHFDESLLWEDLSAQLGAEKKVFIEKRLMLAACITLLIMFFPIILMMDAKPEQLAMDIDPVEDVILTQETINPITDNWSAEKVSRKTPIYSVSKKSVSLVLASSAELGDVHLKPIQMPQEETKKRQLFADQDISIIQANLGTGSIEKGKNFAVRAQLQASSQTVQTNNQELKIKLFGTSNK